MGKLHWVSEGKRIRTQFAIKHIGQLTIEVETNLPGGMARQTAEEGHQLALRHAELLVRGFAAELKRELHR